MMKLSNKQVAQTKENYDYFGEKLEATIKITRQRNDGTFDYVELTREDLNSLINEFSNTLERV